MNKLSLAGAALLLLSADVGAQPTAPVQISVLSEVQLIRFGVTDFGPVGTQASARTYTIDPAGPTGAQQTARFTSTGAPLATIMVSWLSTLDLCHETAECATNKLVFTPNLSSQCCNNQPASSLIASGATVQLNGGGEHYFWLGGSVTVPGTPLPGLYRGDFMLTAVYP